MRRRRSARSSSGMLTSNGRMVRSVLVVMLSSLWIPRPFCRAGRVEDGGTGGGWRSLGQREKGLALFHDVGGNVGRVAAADVPHCPRPCPLRPPRGRVSNDGNPFIAA